MPSAKPQPQFTEDNLKNVLLIQLCVLLYAINKSCQALRGISYTSGDPENDRGLNSFQLFLCKLAQICDTNKGGDTITALVALRAANGPGYLFASNNRREMELKDTQSFLQGLLEFVGRNPEGLGRKAMQKQILWRALEFNFPKVEFYINHALAAIEECIALHVQFEHNSGSEIILELRKLEVRARFPHDIRSGQNARNKFLRDCETLIKAIQVTKEERFSKTILERTQDTRPRISYAWSQLRHYCGRLHSYRQAADYILETSEKWPALFTGFTVGFIPSSRPLKISLPRPTPRPEQVIKAAFQDIDVEEYGAHLESLRRFGLDENFQNKMPQKSMKRSVHCEVLLHSFLVRNHYVEASEYWNNSMFIATSKQPCKLCHYYFADTDNDFQVQSSHMNVYSNWRLPDMYEGQNEDDVEHQEELLDDIIEQVQYDTLQIIRNKLPQGKRNDSRTESRSKASGYMGSEYRFAQQGNGAPVARQHQRDSSSGSDILSETSSTYDVVGDNDYEQPGVAI